MMKNAAHCDYEEFLTVEERIRVESFVEFVRSPSWNLTKGNPEAQDGHDFAVYTMRVPESPLIWVKGSATIDTTLDEILFTMAAIDQFDSFMKMLDDLYRDGEVIAMPSPKHQLCRAAYRLPPLFADRDFVWLNVMTKLADGNGAVSFCWTPQEEDIDELASRFKADRWVIPEARRGDVRGLTIASGIFAERTQDETKCKVSYAVHVDLRGWIPYFLANMVADGQAMNVLRTQKHYKLLREAKEKEKVESE